MIKRSENFKQSAQLIIALAIIEFYQGLTELAMNDEVNEYLVRDIVKEVDMTSQFFIRAFKGSSEARIPLNLVEGSDLYSTLDVDEVVKVAQEALNEQVALLCKNNKKLSIKKMLTGHQPNFLYSEDLRLILSLV